MQLILASNSPRRRELLSKITTNFTVIPSDAPEHSDASAPEQYVCELAQHKAADVFANYSNAVVIGCDTVVDLNGTILGKPHSTRQATEMLHALSGNTHYVHTGVCILYGAQKYLFCVTTSVTFRKLTDSEIDVYVKSGAPMDKAGAYGIQECDFVESIDGSYDNVMGFPTKQVAEILQQIEIK